MLRPNPCAAAPSGAPFASRVRAVSTNEPGTFPYRMNYLTNALGRQFDQRLWVLEHGDGWGTRLAALAPHSLLAPPEQELLHS